MDLEHLRYFVTVARLEHIGKAAEQHGRSEAALSRSIARLEQHYGTQLFEREGRGIRLNERGRVLLSSVERALAELDAVRREFTGCRHPETAPISLGFFATLGARVVPSLVRSFSAKDSFATFRLLQGPAPMLKQRLFDGEIELCLTTRIDDREIDWEPLWSEELFVFVPADHRFAKRSEIDLAELAEDPFVALYPQYGLRSDLDRLCHDAGFHPNVVYEGEEVSTLCGLVAAGLGVTIAPAGDQRAVPIAVREPRCQRTFGVSSRRGKALSHGALTFRNFLRSQPRVSIG